MEKKNKEEPKWDIVGVLWAGGLITISLIILQDLIALTSFDWAALVSIVAFAIAIPIQACILAINLVYKELPPKQEESAFHTIYTSILYSLGTVAAFVGVGAAIWHVSWIAALVFLVSSIAAFIAYATSPH